MIALAERHDLRVLGLILGMPTWLSDCPERGDAAPRCAAREPAEFGRLAAAVAAHARDSIRHWEILNEPDADWAFKGSAEDYARMLSAAYDAIHARVPEARVVMGGVERPRERDWIERMLATPGAEAARKFDIAALHLRLRLRNELADLPAYLRAWRELLAARGFDGPVWVTEHGYPADPAFQWDPAYRGGDAAQAAFLADSLPALADAGADQVFVTLRDNLWGEYSERGPRAHRRVPARSPGRAPARVRRRPRAVPQMGSGGADPGASDLVAVRLCAIWILGVASRVGARGRGGPAAGAPRRPGLVARHGPHLLHAAGR